VNTTTYVGIYVNGGSNNTISDNNVTSTREYAVYLNDADENNINNNILNLYTGSTVKSVIRLRDGSDNNNVSSNTIFSSSLASPGILAEMNSSNNLFEYNVITTTNDGNYGFEIDLSHNNEIRYNNVTTSGGGAECALLNGSLNNTIYSNRFITLGNTANGLSLWWNASNNNISSNYIYTTGADAYGIDFWYSANNNTLSNNNFTVNNSILVRIPGTIPSSDNNQFNNDLLNAPYNTTIQIGEGIIGTQFNNVILDNGPNFTSHSLQGVNLDINSTPPTDPSGKNNLSDYLNINNNSAGGYIDFNLTYSDSDISGMSEDTVRIYRYNDSLGSWQVLSSSDIDISNNIVSSGNISSFSLFAPFGNQIQGCGVITENTNLNQNITSNGTCFTINASNLILDGAGYTITGNTSDYGIYVPNYVTNITIRNFGGINNFTNAIYAWSVINSLITNNTIVAANVGDDYGMYLRSFNSSNVSSNTISTTGNVGTGIYLYEAFSNNVFLNNITTTGTVGYGIYTYSSSGNDLFSNTIRTFQSDAVGIRLDGSSNFNISSNNITTSGTSGHGINIRAFSSSNNISSNNINVTGNSAAGIYISLTSTSNNVNDNIITTSGSSGYGIHVQSSSDSNTFNDNTISTSHATNAYGIYLNNADDNTFLNDKVNSTNSFEIYSISTSTGNNITNMILLGEPNLTTHSFNAISINVNTTPAADPTGKRNLSKYLTITNLSAGGFIDFNLTYAGVNISSMLESSIRIYEYNSSGSWNILATSTVDTTNNIVSSGNITSFSLFAPLGNLDNLTNVTLSLPADNYANSTSDPVNVIFTCNTTEDNSLANVSLYITNSSNQSFSLNSTTNISGTSNSTSWTLSLSNGNYTWNCLAYDTLGNSDWDNNRTLTINYTAPAATPVDDDDDTTTTNGGGGTGTNQVAGQFSKKIWNPLTGGEITILEVDNGAIGITEIEFMTTETLWGAWMKVEKKDSLPSNIESFDKKIYKYILISHGTTLKDETINSPKIKFKVLKSWLKDNGLNKLNVALFRYANDQWNELTTTLLSEDNEYVYYSATTHGFSYFIIGETEQAIESLLEEELGERVVFEEVDVNGEVIEETLVEEEPEIVETIGEELSALVDKVPFLKTKFDGISLAAIVIAIILIIIFSHFGLIMLRKKRK
ncbi:MAG: PGF-pre-PGF domain-containing protein, partial [Nanoarchaeota archaeon]|nr:PGF-pre-PGF domain-containing protein [Nanoarchaeota archaeon]